MTAATAAAIVVVIDDEPLIREGLPLLIPALQFGGSFDGVDAFLDSGVRADVVILDFHLRGVGWAGVHEGVEAVRAVVKAGYRVLVYTSERRRHVLVGALKAGAGGIVHKAEQLDAVVSAVHRIVQGELVVTQAVVGLAELAERRGALPSLTPRQREVLSARARGESFQSIARRLFIAKKTAENHMNAITGKFADYLQTHSAADLERLLGLEPGDLLDDTDRRP